MNNIYCGTAENSIMTIKATSIKPYRDTQPIANEYYAQCAKRNLTPIAPNTFLNELGLHPIDTNMFLNAGLIPQINLPDYSKLPNVMGTGNNSFGDTNINNTITIPIEHVADYNDFVTQLQRDGKFEKMIEDMTIGKLAGKNSLAKNSYKWN